MNCSRSEGESAFDRLTGKIAELDVREAELAEVPTVQSEIELSDIREQRDALKRELEELWARQTNHCCGGE
jgi:uncharacterized protein YdcH (DUF465 family)